jgi:serine protease Do
MEHLPRSVAATEVGKKVTVGLLRDGKRMDVNVTIAEVAEEGPEVQGSAPDVEKYFGLVVQNITPEIARHLDLKDRRGVIVTDVQQESPADDADIRAGDIVKEINKKPVTNVADFREVLAKAKPREGVVMLVRRDNVSFYAVVREEKRK